MERLPEEVVHIIAFETDLTSRDVRALGITNHRFHGILLTHPYDLALVESLDGVLSCISRGAHLPARLALARSPPLDLSTLLRALHRALLPPNFHRSDTTSAHSDALAKALLATPPLADADPRSLEVVPTPRGMYGGLSPQCFHLFEAACRSLSVPRARLAWEHTRDWCAQHDAVIRSFYVSNHYLCPALSLGDVDLLVDVMASPFLDLLSERACLNATRTAFQTHNLSLLTAFVDNVPADIADPDTVFLATFTGALHHIGFTTSSAAASNRHTLDEADIRRWEEMLGFLAAHPRLVAAAANPSASESLSKTFAHVARFAPPSIVAFLLTLSWPPPESFRTMLPAAASQARVAILSSLLDHPRTSTPEILARALKAAPDARSLSLLLDRIAELDDDPALVEACLGDPGALLVRVTGWGSVAMLETLLTHPVTRTRCVEHTQGLSQAALQCASRGLDKALGRLLEAQTPSSSLSPSTLAACACAAQEQGSVSCVALLVSQPTIDISSLESVFYWAVSRRHVDIAETMARSGELGKSLEWYVKSAWEVNLPGLRDTLLDLILDASMVDSTSFEKYWRLASSTQSAAGLARLLELADDKDITDALSRAVAANSVDVVLLLAPHSAAPLGGLDPSYLVRVMGVKHRKVRFRSGPAVAALLASSPGPEGWAEEGDVGRELLFASVASSCPELTALVLPLVPELEPEESARLLESAFASHAVSDLVPLLITHPCVDPSWQNSRVLKWGVRKRKEGLVERLLADGRVDPRVVDVFAMGGCV